MNTDNNRFKISLCNLKLLGNALTIVRKMIVPCGILHSTYTYTRVQRTEIQPKNYVTSRTVGKPIWNNQLILNVQYRFVAASISSKRRNREALKPDSATSTSSSSLDSRLIPAAPTETITVRHIRSSVEFISHRYQELEKERLSLAARSSVRRT